MCFQPRLHIVRCVGGAVVEDDVNNGCQLHATVKQLQKLKELLGPMAPGELPRPPSRGDVQSGVEAYGSISLIVVGSTFDLSGAKRLHRLRSVERLDLSFLIHRQHERVVRGFMFRPTTSTAFSANRRSRLILKVRMRFCGGLGRWHKPPAGPIPKLQ